MAVIAKAAHTVEVPTEVVVPMVGVAVTAAVAHTAVPAGADSTAEATTAVVKLADAAENSMAARFADRTMIVRVIHSTGEISEGNITAISTARAAGGTADAASTSSVGSGSTARGPDGSIVAQYILTPTRTAIGTFTATTTPVSAFRSSSTKILRKARRAGLGFPPDPGFFVSSVFFFRG